MIGSTSTSRRANAFAQALEERDTGGTAAGHAASEGREDRAPVDSGGATDDTDGAALLAVAQRLRALPSPQLDPEVKTVHRAQLIAAMEAARAERTAGPAVPEQRAPAGRRGRRRIGVGALGRMRPRSRLSKGLAAGGLTVGVAAGAFTGVAAASGDALPGDSLYGLKRGMEDLRLTMAGSDEERGAVYLNQASTRLKEVRRLMERKRSGELDEESLVELRKALASMRDDASAGHRLLRTASERDGSLTPLRSLSAFSARHSRTWEELRGQLPPQLSELGDKVSSVLDTIQSQVGPLRARLSDDGTAARRDVSDTPRGGEDSGPLTPPSAAGPSASGSPDRGPERSGSHGPESSETQGDELLDGRPGLLGPPSDGGEQPSTSGEPSPGPSPDITLPPLVPGLLPDLIPPQQQPDT